MRFARKDETLSGLLKAQVEVSTEVSGGKWELSLLKQSRAVEWVGPILNTEYCY